MRGICMVVLVGVLGGCNSLQVVTGDGEGLPCQENLDCAQGLECRDSKCARPPATDGGPDGGGGLTCGEALLCWQTCSGDADCLRCTRVCNRARTEYESLISCCCPDQITRACVNNCSTACSIRLGDCQGSSCT